MRCSPRDGRSRNLLAPLAPPLGFVGVVTVLLVSPAPVSAHLARVPYTAVELQYGPDGTFGYPDGGLAEDGRVAGKVYLNTTAAPYAVAAVWNSAGIPQAQAVNGLYEQAVAHGFNGNGGAIGIIAGIGQAGGPPVVWDGPLPTDLPVPEAWGFPDDGNGTTIVGAAIVGTGVPGEITQRACLWRDGSYQLLAVAGATSSRVTSINDSGVYVGTGFDATNPNSWKRVGFYGRDGSATTLNYASFPQAAAAEVNDSDWFTGTYHPAIGGRRPFVARAFSDEVYGLEIPPGYFEAIAQGINNDRTVVGSVRGSGDWERALIWPNGSPTPIDLNDYVNVPGVTFIRGLDINNAGQILAEGRLHAGGYAYYVLTPVPEPALAVAALAVPAVARRRRRAVIATP